MKLRLSAGIGVLILGLVGLAASPVVSQEDRTPAGRPAPAAERAGEAPAGSDPRPGPGASIRRGPVEVRQGYQVTVGPWTWRFSAPESLDLFDLIDRVRAFFGMLAILG